MRILFKLPALSRFCRQPQTTTRPADGESVSIIADSRGYLEAEAFLPQDSTKNWHPLVTTSDSGSPLTKTSNFRGSISHNSLDTTKQKFTVRAIISLPTRLDASEYSYFFLLLLWTAISFGLHSARARITWHFMRGDTPFIHKASSTSWISSLTQSRIL